MTFEIRKTKTMQQYKFAMKWKIDEKRQNSKAMREINKKFNVTLSCLSVVDLFIVLLRQT